MVDSTETKPHISKNYKWIALSNTTLGMLMATINSSSILIALPAVFRGIRLNPLNPSNFQYLLWILMGYLLVSAVLVVTLGRLGDMFGRVKIYNAGFLIFTIASIFLSLTFGHGQSAALQIVIMRMVQAVGGSMVMANSVAILTDAFPVNERGMAMGINIVAGVAGQFLGLILGGVLASINWRWVFLINVPIGLFGTVWAYLKLRDQGAVNKSKIDWIGNITFAIGLSLILVGITYALQPYHNDPMGWTSPKVLVELVLGVIVLVFFVLLEKRHKDPMFRISLFKLRQFRYGNLAGLMSSVAQGGLMFMLVIWLQGIWLPIHGYSFSQTPLWAGIFLLPLTGGFLVAGPLSGKLSDTLGARPFATFGMFFGGITFLLMILLSADFNYIFFALIIFLNGLAFGFFSAPNTVTIMNAVAPKDRGSASGMRVTFRFIGTPLSIGIFFSLMVIGLNSSMPSVLYSGLISNHVPHTLASHISAQPPIGYLFAAFLGYNPMGTMLGNKVLAKIPSNNSHLLTSTSYFPRLISSPFMQGLDVVLIFAGIVCFIAALFSFLQGPAPKLSEKEEIVDDTPLKLSEEELTKL
jgi:EmrB/QacA subfamily drug resistance transporter